MLEGLQQEIQKKANQILVKKNTLPPAVQEDER